MTDFKNIRAKDVDLELCRELFTLDAAAGALTRRVSRGTARAGKSAILLRWDPRFQEYRAIVRIDRQEFQAPRIILSMAQGRPVDPSLVVDHINGDPLDNRVENLREVTRTENQRNRKDNRRAPTVDGEVDPW